MLLPVVLYIADFLTAPHKVAGLDKYGLWLHVKIIRLEAVAVVDINAVALRWCVAGHIASRVTIPDSYATM